MAPVPDDHSEPGIHAEKQEPESALVEVPSTVATPPMAPTLPADVRLTLLMFSKALSGLFHQIIFLAQEWDEGKYSKSYSYGFYPGDEQRAWPLLPKQVASLPKAEAFSSAKIGNVVERAHTFVRAQMPLIARLGKGGDPRALFKDVGYDAFRAFFDDEELFPMPKSIVTKEKKYWMRDDCFAEQFLNGCNPTVIHRVTKEREQMLDSMPTELKGEVDEDGRGVGQLMNEGCLYVADYAVLEKVYAMLKMQGVQGGYDDTTGAYVNEICFDGVGSDRSMKKYFYAPYVAFYQRRDGRLGVLGVVLTRFKDRPNFVYNTRTCRDRETVYAFAKMHVACADNQTHQFYYHLGRCHLAFESFGVAIRNVFQYAEDEQARDHVVGRLLKDHFKDHIAINWLARNTLVAHGEDAIPFTDAGFALGARGGLTLLAAQYSTWKFGDQAFPKQLENRGFGTNGDDGLLYYYREDGMKIWTVMRRYVERALKAYYSCSDDAQRDTMVAKDMVLERWCKEMRARDKAAVRSFPERFDTLDQLVDAVATIMYNVSAEHSAVNTSQERYLSYVPNRPNALFKPCPPPDASKDMNLLGEVLMIHRARGDDDDVGASMPLAFALFQVQFSQLLTMKPTKTLVEVEGEGVDQDAVRMFKEELMEISQSIGARNEQILRETPHLPPYEFLDPVQVAQSIEI